MAIRSTKPDMSILTGYGNALRALPGVTDITVKKDGLHVATRSPRDSKFLDGLLEDSIQGVEVHFDAAPVKPKAPKQADSEASIPKVKNRLKPGKKASPRPQLSPSEKAVKRYGKALAHIPHVTGVTADSNGSVVVHVDEKKSIGFVDDLVEDKLNGVLVQFEAAR